MTDKEILSKSIDKALTNGFKFSDGNWDKIINNGFTDIAITIYITTEVYKIIIFNHSFAKAFWGEERIIDHLGINGMPKWEIHLQQMVLEEEPLKYLKRFL